MVLRVVAEDVEIAEVYLGDRLLCYKFEMKSISIVGRMHGPQRSSSLYRTLTQTRALCCPVRPGEEGAWLDYMNVLLLCVHCERPACR